MLLNLSLRITLVRLLGPPSLLHLRLLTWFGHQRSPRAQPGVAHRVYRVCCLLVGPVPLSLPPLCIKPLLLLVSSKLTRPRKLLNCAVGHCHQPKGSRYLC